MHQNDGWFNPLSINGQQCMCGTGPANGCGDWDSTQPTATTASCPSRPAGSSPTCPTSTTRTGTRSTTMIDDARLLGARGRRRRLPRRRGQALPAWPRRCACAPSCTIEFEHAGPLFYLVGETFDGDRGFINSFIGPHALHAQFDFPIYFNVINTLATYSNSLRDLEAATAASDAAFGDAPMSPFLGNHDVARFLSTAAGMLTGDPQGAGVERAAGGADDRGRLLQAAAGADLRGHLAGRAARLLRRRVRPARRRRSRQPPLHEVAHAARLLAVRAGDARRDQEARRRARGAGGAAPRRSQDPVDRRRPLRLRAHDHATRTWPSWSSIAASAAPGRRRCRCRRTCRSPTGRCSTIASAAPTVTVTGGTIPRRPGRALERRAGAMKRLHASLIVAARCA